MVIRLNNSVKVVSEKEFRMNTHWFDLSARRVVMLFVLALAGMFFTQCTTVEPEKSEEEAQDDQTFEELSTESEASEGEQQETSWESESTAEQDKNQARDQETVDTSKDGNKTVHTVKEGENLWSIARQHYGSGMYWPAIDEANNLDNPDQLAAGQKLDIPRLSEKRKQELKKQASNRSTGTFATEESSVDQGTYVTREGDSFWKIAQRVYGNGAKWTVIWKANKSKVPDPDQLKAGVKLQIPSDTDGASGKVEKGNKGSVQKGNSTINSNSSTENWNEQENKGSVQKGNSTPKKGK